MRIGIVGSRDFKDLKLVQDYVKGLAKDDVVISGGARGVDKTAVETAIACGLKTEVYLPDWSTEGRMAGFNRNTTIVEQSDCITAFWDGVSNGTRDTMTKAKLAGKTVSLFLAS